MMTNDSRTVRSKTNHLQGAAQRTMLTALSLLLVAGCGEGANLPNGEGPPANASAPSTDAGAPAPPPPPAVGGEPMVGVYVSASNGSAGTDGTKLRPLKTIAEGQVLAASKRAPLIVCAERYDEAVDLADGVTMYGYFDCSNLEKWQRVEKRAAIVAPRSPAVRAIGLTRAARFEGFDVQSPDASGPVADGKPAASSYGMTIADSKGLVIAEVGIVAGAGQDGRDGAEPAHGPVEASNTAGTASQAQHACDRDVDGLYFCQTAEYVPGMAGGTSSCGGGPGGAGGDAPVARDGFYHAASSVAASGKPAAGSAQTAAGGAASTLGAGKGTDGMRGTDGITGTNGAWSFDASGFIPGNGTGGGVGSPGQGGGGGAGTTAIWNLYAYPKPTPLPNDGVPAGIVLGAAGGGGGAGGCGGVPGTPGTGGGASIGIFVVNSELTLERVRIESRKGGRGGNGTVGSYGTAGGAGGVGAPTTTAFRGAPGGKGGAGGSAGLSGFGAPGASIALVFTGLRPSTLDGVELVPGPGGDGAQHALEQGAQLLPKLTGISKHEHQF